ncbi:MAG: phosphoenolpyruvate--protein phosphotransferase [Clostridiales bacterium]
MLIKGIAASFGIAIGKVYIQDNRDLIINKYPINDIEKELTRLSNAQKSCKLDLEKLIVKTKSNIGNKESEIIQTHLDIIDDEGFFDDVKSIIKNDKFNSEFAIDSVTKTVISSLEEIEDEYIKARIIDIKDVSTRIIKCLLNIADDMSTGLTSACILTAKDLKPSETAQLDTNQILGFVTQEGSKTSHTSIFAKALGIPAIVGIPNLLSHVKSNDLIILDGENGILHINPDIKTLAKYAERKDSYDEEVRKLEKLKNIPCKTLDNFNVKLYANAGTLNEVESAIKNGCMGIGLFRTEYLFMNTTSLPTEEYQFNFYKKIVEMLDDKPITIRTLDIGGDKEVECLKLPDEKNPFLGYRGIRICLDNVELFKIQLKAILRSSSYGNVRIMFPMISSTEELESSLLILNNVKSELKLNNMDFNENIKVGMMIEIPSAVIISDMLSKKVDFFSIGTNDLIQYSNAVDRMNQKVSSLYTHFSPSILRMLKLILNNANFSNIEVGICGEAANDINLIPLLISMGFNELSIGPSTLLKIKEKINSLNKNNLEYVYEKVRQMTKSIEIEEYLKRL